MTAKKQAVLLWREREREREGEREREREEKLGSRI